MYVKHIADLIFTCVHFSYQTITMRGDCLCSSRISWESVVVQVLWPCYWYYVCAWGPGATYSSLVGVKQMQKCVLALPVPLASGCLMDLSHSNYLNPSTALCRIKTKQNKKLVYEFHNVRWQHIGIWISSCGAPCASLEIDLTLLWIINLLRNWIHLPH